MIIQYLYFIEVQFFNRKLTPIEDNKTKAPVIIVVITDSQFVDPIPKYNEKNLLKIFFALLNLRWQIKTFMFDNEGYTKYFNFYKIIRFNPIYNYNYNLS